MELIEALRRLSTIKGRPFTVAERAMAAIAMSEAAAALEAAQKDSKRLDWLAIECIPEGLIHVELDIHDYACKVADENGRDEPIDADHFAGYRRMIDAARASKQRDEEV